MPAITEHLLEGQHLNLEGAPWASCWPPPPREVQQTGADAPPGQGLVPLVH